MRLLRRPGFRFVVEAAAILLAALIAGMRDVGWPGIVAAVAVVWVVAALTEYSLSGAKRTRAARPAARPPVAERPAETVRLLPREPEPVPYPVAVEVEVAREAELAPEPEPEPAPAAVGAEPLGEPEPQRWNIWDLERAVRESGEVSEEQEFLLLYLRDYADPDGLLPFDFDELVRDSFRDALTAVVAG
jgi:hypothetical protein